VRAKDHEPLPDVTRSIPELADAAEKAARLANASAQWGLPRVLRWLVRK
jgi:hypothetical protein